MNYSALRCPKCMKTNIRPRKGGMVRCYDCHGLLRSSELVKMEKPKTYPCGHERSIENTLRYRTNTMCKCCHQARSRAYHNAKNPKLALYPSVPCRLAEVWK